MSVELIKAVPLIPLLLVLGAGCVAAFTDIRSFKIPNYITLPLLLAGILFHAFLPTGQGISFGLLGAVAVGLAMTAESVISALSIFYTLMGVGLFVPMLAGLFVPRARTAGAVASTVAGVVVVVAVQAFGHPGPPWMTPALWGLLAAIVAMLVALALPARPRTAA